jgi:CDP-diacylglycerol--glycerol-3-phosphate 3-phosphatidyltransferase
LQRRSALSVSEHGAIAPASRFRALGREVSRRELPPVLLTAARVGLAPLLLIGVAMGMGPRLTAAFIGIGFFSDVIDGYVARWLKVDNAFIRGFDSFADTVFYLAALYPLFHFEGTMLPRHAALIGVVIGTQLLEHLIEVAKFGKPASYHAMSAKVWGVTLPIALISVLLAGRDDFLVLALVAGLLSHVDCFVITMILPSWHHDVATFYDALAIRREELARSHQ